MKTTNTFNTASTDNAAATILLSALFVLITAAVFTSTKAEAKEVSYKATPHVETIVVTATRLK